MNFGTIGRSGESEPFHLMKWRLVLNGVVMGYARKAEHFNGTIRVLGGGVVEPVGKGELLEIG